MAVTYQSVDNEIQLTGVVTVGEFRAATTSSGLSFSDGTYTLHSDMRLMASCDLSVFGNVRIDLNGHEIHINSGTEDIIWRDVQFIDSSDRTNADRFPWDRDELGYSARGGSIIATMDGDDAKLAVWARDLSDVRILAEDHVANDIDGVLWFNQTRTINGLSLIRVRRVASDMSRIRIRDLSISSNSSAFGPLVSLNRNGSLLLENATITSLYPDMPSGYATARDFNQNETRIAVNGALPAIPRGARFRLPLGADTRVYTVEIGADATTDTSTGKYITIKPPLGARKTIGESLHTENSGVTQVVGAFRGNSEHWLIACGTAEEWLRPLLPLNGTRVTHIHGGFHGMGGGVRYYRLVGGEGGVVRLSVDGVPEFPSGLRLASATQSLIATWVDVDGATDAIPAGSQFRINGGSTVFTVTSDVAAAADATTSRRINFSPAPTVLYLDNATCYPAGFIGSNARPHKPDLTQASLISSDTETTIGSDERLEAIIPSWIARIGDGWNRADASNQMLRGWKYGKQILEIDCSTNPTAIIGAHDGYAPIPWRDDESITESDSAVVAAYTTLETSAKMHDRLTLQTITERKNAFPTSLGDDGVLDFGASNVTLATSGDALSYASSTDTWTFNVGTSFDGGIRTTGLVTVPSDVTVSGAIFDRAGDSRITFTVPSGLDEAIAIFTDRATASEDAGPFVGTPQLLMVGRSYDTMFAVSTVDGSALTVGQSRTYGWEFGWPTAFAFVSATRSVWTAERSTNALYSWSLATGATTRVGTAMNWGLAGGTVEMNGFVLQGSTLWACSTSSIYTINTTTGEATAATLAQGSTLPAGIVDVSFSSSTRLHVLASGGIHEYSVSGTTLTAVRRTTFADQSAATGLAWTGTTMYMVGRTPAAVYTLDLTGATYGAISRIGTVDEFDVTEPQPSGIAWSPSLPIGRIATIPTGRSLRYLAAQLQGRTVYLRLTQQNDGAAQLYAVTIPMGAGDYTLSVLATPADVARDRILARVEDVLTAIDNISVGGGGGSLTTAQAAALNAIRAAIHPSSGSDQIAALATALDAIPSASDIATATTTSVEASSGKLSSVEGKVDTIDAIIDVLRAAIHPSGGSDQIAALDTAIGRIGSGGGGSLTTAQATALGAIRAAIHPDGGSDQIGAIKTAVGAIPTTTPSIPTPPTASAIATATRTAMEASGTTLASINAKVDTVDAVVDVLRAAIHPTGGDDQIAALATSVGAIPTTASSGSLTTSQAAALTAIRAAIHPDGGSDQIAALATAVGGLSTGGGTGSLTSAQATALAAIRAAIHPSSGSDQIAAVKTAIGALTTPPSASAIAAATKTAMEGSGSTLASVNAKVDTMDAVVDVIRAAIHPTSGDDQVAALATAVGAIPTTASSGSLTTSQAAALAAIRAAIHPDGGSDQIAALATAVGGISSGGSSGSLTAAQAAALAAIRAAIHPSSGSDQIASLKTAIGALTAPPSASDIATELERADGPIDTIKDALADGDDGLAAIATAIGAIPTTHPTIPTPPSVAQIRTELERTGGTLDDVEGALSTLATAVGAIPTTSATPPSAADVATQVWAATSDGTVDASTALRAILAVVAGRATITANGVDYVRQDGSTVAVRAVVDAQGNRTTVEIDPR